ncbi:MAG: TylF/MycF family methyltransferase [Dysosmobacter sp.]|nr:TylF/MycF family methyltransferase [Dysosmobacter sp.]
MRQNTGYIPDTVKGLESESCCFVSLDADLYKPILAGLEYFYPRLSPGGYIFVHDFVPLSFGPGVRTAVREYCSAHNISYVPMLDRQGSVVITK